MKLAISFVFFSFLLVSIEAARNPRQIVGGSNADIKNYPYQASLRYKNLHGCGGSIISEKHILTAAHCIKSVFAPPFAQCTVNVGTSTTTESGFSYSIAGVTMHPEWNAKDDKYLSVHDIAIVTLVGKIRFNPYQQKIALPTGNILKGETATLTGWGYSSTGIRRMSEQLQMIKLLLLTYDECQPRHRKTYKSDLHKKQLCVYHPKGLGPCKGDSGGPVVVNNKVVGIVSYGIKGDCEEESVDVITNVFAYKDFIERVLAK